MFIITILCKDDDDYYIDYVNKGFKTFEEAQEEMYKCANGELRELQQIGDYEKINLTREFFIYNEDRELITQYKIIEINN